MNSNHYYYHVNIHLNIQRRDDYMPLSCCRSFSNNFSLLQYISHGYQRTRIMSLSIVLSLKVKQTKSQLFLLLTCRWEDQTDWQTLNRMTYQLREMNTFDVLYLDPLIIIPTYTKPAMPCSHIIIYESEGKRHAITLTLKVSLLTLKYEFNENYKQESITSVLISWKCDGLVTNNSFFLQFVNNYF